MDEQIKVVNRTLGSMLICMIKETLTSWKDRLLLIEFTYNRFFHSFIGMSPFKACYGFKHLFTLMMALLSSYVIVSLDVKKRVRK